MTQRLTVKLAPAFLVCAHAIVRKPSIPILKSGSLFGCFLNSFLPSSHRSLPMAIALTLTLALTMTVFRSLTFWSSSIFIRHITHLLFFQRTDPVCKIFKASNNIVDTDKSRDGVFRMVALYFFASV